MTLLTKRNMRNLSLWISVYERIYEYSNIFEYFPTNIDIRIRFVANFKAEYYLNIFVRIFPNIGL